MATVAVTNSDGQTSFYATTVAVTHTLTMTESVSNTLVSSPSSSDSGTATAKADSTTTAAQSGSLATGGTDGSGSSGLSSKDRSIVIGVVVGVGGFLLLLGVAFVCWKIWGRRSNGGLGRIGSHDDGSTTMEKNAALSLDVDDTSDVFRANIEQYHAPRPNTAANF